MSWPWPTARIDVVGLGAAWPSRVHQFDNGLHKTRLSLHVPLTPTNKTGTRPQKHTWPRLGNSQTHAKHNDMARRQQPLTKQPTRPSAYQIGATRCCKANKQSLLAGHASHGADGHCNKPVAAVKDLQLRRFSRRPEFRANYTKRGRKSSDFSGEPQNKALSASSPLCEAGSAELALRLAFGVFLFVRFANCSFSLCLSSDSSWSLLVFFVCGFCCFSRVS